MRLLAVSVLVGLLSASGTYAQQNPAAFGFDGLGWNDEYVIPNLSVQGTIPTWLTGTLYRIGPGKYDLSPTLNVTHWWDGLAVLHSFAFAEGSVTFRNKWVNDTMYQQNAPKSRKGLHKGVSGSTGYYSPNTLVTIRQTDGAYLTATGAMLTNEFDPITLASPGVNFDYNDSVTAILCPEHAQTALDGTVVQYAINFLPAQYQLYTVAPGTRTRVYKGAFPVNAVHKLPMYSHSFGLTANYLIMAETPCTYGDFPNWRTMKWLPQLGTTWRVISLENAAQVATFTTPAFFMEHFVNSYEATVDGEDVIVVDIITYRDNAVIDALYLDVIINHYAELQQISMDFGQRLTRFVLPLSQPGTQVLGTLLSSLPSELPTIDYANLNTKPYQYTYAIGLANVSTSAWFDTLNKFDVSTVPIQARPSSVGSSEGLPDYISGHMEVPSLSWTEADCYPGEPIFVPAPNPTAEDDGVLLSVVINSVTQSSFLLVLDAHTLQELGRAEVPDYVVPFGFHGAYYKLASASQRLQ